MCTNHLQHIFLGVDLCLFKVLCLIEVTSNFTQEKTTTFIFSLYLVLPVGVN